MLSPAAKEKVRATTSSSFACDLKKWLEIMEAYEKGGHAYHATMPTDALRGFRDDMQETGAYGFATVKAEREELGARARAPFDERAFISLARAGRAAPGTVVGNICTPGNHLASKRVEKHGGGKRCALPICG